MIAQAELSDAERLEFIRQLDDAPFQITNWEAEFVASLLARERYRTELATFLSPAQREKIDQLRQEYEHRLPRKECGKVKKESPHIPPFVPGQCAWLHRSEGRSQRCGQPATQKTRLGLELCDVHWREHVEGVERIRQMKTRVRR